MIRVAAAVIRKGGRVLVCRRKEGKRLAGTWEFPGGKIEPGESASAALIREIKEELGVEVAPIKELMTVRHRYDFGEIELVAVLCGASADPVSSTDHDRLEWCWPEALMDYELAPADVPIADRLEAGDWRAELSDR